MPKVSQSVVKVSQSSKINRGGGGVGLPSGRLNCIHFWGPDLVRQERGRGRKGRHRLETKMLPRSRAFGNFFYGFCLFPFPFFLRSPLDDLCCFPTYPAHYHVTFIKVKTMKVISFETGAPLYLIIQIGGTSNQQPSGTTTVRLVCAQQQEFCKKFLPALSGCLPHPTANGGMQNGSSVGTCTHCILVFAHFGTDLYARVGA